MKANTSTLQGVSKKDSNTMSKDNGIFRSQSRIMQKGIARISK